MVGNVGALPNGPLRYLLQFILVTGGAATRVSGRVSDRVRLGVYAASVTAAGVTAAIMTSLIALLRPGLATSPLFPYVAVLATILVLMEYSAIERVGPRAIRFYYRNVKYRGSPVVGRLAQVGCWVLVAVAVLLAAVTPILFVSW